MQPFVGKKAEDVRFMRVLAPLEEDPNLRIPNFMIDVQVGVGSIPAKVDWNALQTAVRKWFRDNAASLPIGTSEHTLPATGLFLTITKPR